MCPRCGWAVQRRSAPTEPQGQGHVAVLTTEEQSAARRRCVGLGAGRSAPRDVSS
jgi:hypothetical protein